MSRASQNVAGRHKMSRRVNRSRPKETKVKKERSVRAQRVIKAVAVRKRWLHGIYLRVVELQGSMDREL